MIAASDSKLDLGPFTPSFGFSDWEGRDHPPQPFLVVREATADEYLAFCEETGANMAKANQAARMYQHFYEVMTD